MRSSRSTTLVVLLCALTLGGALGAIRATASAGSKPKATPLCTFGETSTVAKKCTANPAFGKSGCAQLVPAIQALIGTAPTPTPNKTAPSANQLDCYYTVGGQIQAFGVGMFVGPTVKSIYQQGYQDDVSEAASLSCDNENGTSFPPANAPATLSGLGAEAYDWDQCTPHGQNDDTIVSVVNGDVYYTVYSKHPATDASVTQLATFVRQLMAKYR